MSQCKKPLKKSIILVCTLFIASVCLMISAVTYREYRNALYSRYERYITDLLRFAGRSVDVDDLERCLENEEKSAHFMEVQTLFDRIKDTHEIDFLYIVIPLHIGDTDNMRNVMAAMSSYEREYEPETEVVLGGLTGDSYPSKTAAKYYNAANSEGKITFFEEKTEWGNDYTGVLPLINSKGEFFAELCVDVSVDAIYTTLRNQMILYSSLIALLGIAAIFLFIWWISRNVVSPILQLEDSVAQFAAHSHERKDIQELTLEIPEFHTENEVESLAASIKKMSEDMKDYVTGMLHAEQTAEIMKNKAERMSWLAVRDSLTGVRNKAAYDEAVKNLRSDFEKGDRQFGVVMVDLDSLKQINDTYGHEKGNLAIKTLSSIISSTYSHSPVYRIGGDEFAVILRGSDYKNANNLANAFKAAIEAASKDETAKPWERIRAALGCAMFNETRDDGYDSVFDRADRQMIREKMAAKKT